MAGTVTRRRRRGPCRSSLRGVTRYDPHAPPALSAKEFKAALAQFATGVVLVTSDDDGEDAAMTASAFLSLSIDPPLVLLSVRAGSRMHGVLTRQPHWAASVLSAGQQPVAARFAVSQRPTDRLLFADLAHHRGPYTGALILDHALAAVECRTEQVVPAGDHTLVIGRVLAAERRNPDAPALLRFRSRYRTLPLRS